MSVTTVFRAVIRVILTTYRKLILFFQMLRVAALQIKSSSNKSELFQRITDLVTDAATKHKSQLIILPEAFTGLYGVKHFESNAETWKAKDSGTKLMSDLALQHQIHIVGGVIEQHPINKKMYNTIAAFAPNGVECARYRKMHLSKVSVGEDDTSEGSVLESGEELSWFDIAESNDTNRMGSSWRIGLASCFDLRFHELSDLLVKPPPHGLGSDVLVYPSSWLKSTGDLGHWDVLLKARALDGQCYTMGISNSEDAGQETVAFGSTQIIDPMGQVVSKCLDNTADEIVSGVLFKDKMIEVRNKRIPLQRCKRPIIYKDALRNAQGISSAMMRAPTGMD